MTDASGGAERGGAGFACFGELILRLTPPGRQLLGLATSLEAHPGGAEGNVAAALASLGHPVRMVTCVPPTALGTLALRSLRLAGVDCGHVRRGEGRMALYFMAAGAGPRASEIVYDRADSAFSRCGSEDFDWAAAFTGVGWLHLSGITPALGPRSADTALAAVAAAKRHGLRISFDGNYRASLWRSNGGDPRGILRALVGHADLLFGDRRDMSLLLGETFGDDRERAAAEATFAAFPDLRLIASTSRVAEDADRHWLAARIDGRDRVAQTERLLLAGIVDRVGGGDAFAAGVLHALAGDPADLDRAAASGLALAALKHTLPGDAALVTQGELDHFAGGERDIRR